MKTKELHKTRTAVAILTVVAAAALLVSFRMPGRHGGDYDEPEGIDLSAYELVDGTYTGTAAAFRPDLTVEVVVEGGEVQSIEIVSHQEIGRQCYALPMDVIPQEIVDKQQTEVDSVSGATATSKGIMAAVENALTSATR